MPRAATRANPGLVRGMTVQGVRSKERVVRLEPFFPTEAVAGAAARRLHHAVGAGGAQKLVFQAARRAAADDSNRTDTRFETPDSSMVTPYSVVAAAIVFFECVTTMNWVVDRKSRSTPT